MEDVTLIYLKNEKIYESWQKYVHAVGDEFVFIPGAMKEGDGDVYNSENQWLMHIWKIGVVTRATISKDMYVVPKSLK